jgi:macrophage erythroblast attacher
VKDTLFEEMYDNKRWTDLVESYRQENYQLYSLSYQPMLTMKLEAGLSALKSPMCYQIENKNMNCPVCSDLLGELAKSLPYSHHINSCIVCRISGEIMDENNYPMMLPNGNVYSYKSLKEMADKNNNIVTCIRTGESYNFSELKKCFIS